ncbi:S24/S26 family peptidase [Sphingobacterium spiritivorum]|uniref:S24/S26 family peptidase n=1 Tax=Sphingobacterium spiritivorum TaxID=258 RepID=UPI0036C8DA5E
MIVSDKNKYIMDNDLFFEQVRQMLDNNKTVKIPVTGTSMSPFLCPDDHVVLEKILKTDLTCGRVVLAVWNKAYILHRIVWKEKNGERIRLAGDGNLVQVENTTLSDILAVVVTAYRGEKKINIDSTLQIYVGLIWYRLRFLRRVYHKLKNF